MGGLWKKLPLAYASFVVGGAALAALPFLTAGFYSKDEILWEAFASGHRELLIAGLVGAFLTSIYTFRLIFVAFHGEPKTEAHAGHGISHWLPLSVLIVLSTFVGALITPPLAGVLPESVGHAGGEAKHSLNWPRVPSPSPVSCWPPCSSSASAASSAPWRRAPRVASSVPGGTTPGASTGCTTSCS